MTQKCSAMESPITSTCIIAIDRGITILAPGLGRDQARMTRALLLAPIPVILAPVLVLALALALVLARNQQILSKIAERNESSEKWNHCFFQLVPVC